MKSNPYEHMYLRDQEVADAIRTVLRSMPSLHVGGRSFTPEQLATLIERRVAAANEHDAAEAAWAEKAEAYCDLDDVVGPAMCDLRKLAPLLFGPKSPVLGALGLKGPPRKSGPTPASKGVALERRWESLTAAAPPKEGQS